MRAKYVPGLRLVVYIMFTVVIVFVGAAFWTPRHPGHQTTLKCACDTANPHAPPSPAPVRAGFYCVEERDSHRCWHCSVGRNQRQPGDNPEKERVRYSPRWAFLIRVVGCAYLLQTLMERELRSETKKFVNERHRRSLVELEINSRNRQQSFHAIVTLNAVIQSELHRTSDLSNRALRNDSLGTRVTTPHCPPIKATRNDT